MMKQNMWMTVAVAAVLAAGPALADGDACKPVRMSDLGWTDIAFTNATAELLLGALGYEPSQTLLGLDVTYVSLQNNWIDVFQGNWRPVQDEQFQKFFDDGSVEVLGTNLTGAKFTLAVPDYVAAAGVKSFDDLAAHADAFGSNIYGIEAGSNKPLLDMVEANAHGMKGWNIVESSEAGMLAQVARSVADKKWIVFLGWAPHPMNIDYKLTYLSGGDKEYGPDFGGATVRTIGREGYAKDCPNAARLFANLVYDVDYESRGMQMIMADGKSPAEAAKAMIAAEPARLDKWLDGVTTLAGEPGLAAARAELGL
ncbi:MAG: choline ABC transporter substrate-binding protein [Proteobacteria bacterium]|nr:choline ABC transporter substrate-binding protein [Pseudomonadota bacterium]MBS0571811.1 choline ABC transporter substrate-binding protein [Pseudomonadota bacterium]